MIIEAIIWNGMMLITALAFAVGFGILIWDAFKDCRKVKK